MRSASHRDACGAQRVRETDGRARRCSIRAEAEATSRDERVLWTELFLLQWMATSHRYRARPVSRHSRKQRQLIVSANACYVFLNTSRTSCNLIVSNMCCPIFATTPPTTSNHVSCSRIETTPGRAYLLQRQQQQQRKSYHQHYRTHSSLMQ